MTPANNVDELKGAIAGTLALGHDSVKIINQKALRESVIDKLAWTVAFSASEEARSVASWIIRLLAKVSGNGPSSINGVYLARGRGEINNSFTVPAINIRAMAYDFARAVFRAVKRHEAGAVICEIARSEMGYTKQPPQEYTSSILAGAIKESYPWPVFIQGDHFQVNAKNYAADPAKEMDGLKKLISQSIDAGFFNIDLDTSTLVDLNKGDLDAQQSLNYKVCAELTSYIREKQGNAEVSVGGEIGEVGAKNSTIEDLDAFMNGYRKSLKGGIGGISKISVQTGTTHGGVVLPDGTMAKVKVDFETLKKLSEAARSKYGMGGAVQHGASTLPVEMFDQFPKIGTCEIHLATEFQNMIFEHPKFPADLKTEVYAYQTKECANERKSGESDNQFFYKTRKKAIGAFKTKMWSLPDGVREEMMKSIEQKVELLISKLNTRGTGPLIKPHVKMTDVQLPEPKAGGVSVVEKFEGAD